VHVWIVAHPTKLQKDQKGEYPVPTPYDISGSAHWRNKADNCLAVYRRFDPHHEPPVEVHVQKVRFREVGKIGLAELRYEKVNGNYREIFG
jgi:twinkle protein